MTNDPCLVESCPKPRRNKHKPSYCAAHQNRVRTHGDPLPHVPLREYSKTGICAAEDCGKKVQARGLCSTHDWRMQNWGTFDTTGRRLIFRQEDGARRLDRDGYVTVKAPNHSEARSNGWAREHRKVMSDHLGRPLTRTENVHHKNGIRDDNRIENLELWNTIQPSGQRVEDKIRFAIEVLRLYHPEMLKDG